MKEILFVTGMSGIFIILTVIVLLLMRRAGKLSSIIWSCVYLALISLLFELARQFQTYLGKHEIYLDFGHADLGLIILMSFCYFIAILTIIVVFIMRSQLRK